MVSSPVKEIIAHWVVKLHEVNRVKRLAQSLVHSKSSQVKSLSRVRLFVTPWTVAHQAPLPMGFSRQEYWSGLSFASLGDLLDPGIEPRSPAL